ncbi:MAG TPA: c-type cytochrome [Isosphaeraceae bacterium]|nr:c-type cytochrome [Isosphaeraceae bacterium]
MTPRFRSALICGALALAGCADNSGPTAYVRNTTLADELKVKPAFREQVAKVLDETFGPSPRDLRVPEGTDLLMGGVFLANTVRKGDPNNPQIVPIIDRDTKQPIEGGYALYRRHCLHCHGVSGDGNGPTSEWLWPHPRDYRPGVFKFTSTAAGQKPTRADLRKTILQGIDNSSMPAFATQMSRDEIEQVLDYVMFLSMRGEVERRLLNAVAGAEESDTEALSADIIKEETQAVLTSWTTAREQVVDPPIPRSPTPDIDGFRASVLRGRELFLKQDCKDCHGTLAQGDGGSFVRPEISNRIIFELAPRPIDERVKLVTEEQFEEYLERSPLAEKTGSDRREAIEQERKSFEEKFKKDWENSLDDWKQPIRPANLNRGVYKGGRRPIDIFWRIRKGINGAKMPAHDLPPEQIWDLVNFVLTLPDDPDLLRKAPPGLVTPTSPTPAPSAPKPVAQR